MNYFFESEYTDFKLYFSVYQSVNVNGNSGHQQPTAPPTSVPKKEKDLHKSKDKERLSDFFD